MTKKITYATGRRKTSSARVWIMKGNGKITVNSKTSDDYFVIKALRNLLSQPFLATNTVNEYDVKCTVSGGGLSGQAGAIRHGISKALNIENLALRPNLKSNGLLTRDSRKVERKKYGRKKARKSFQFSKR